MWSGSRLDWHGLSLKATEICDRASQMTLDAALEPPQRGGEAQEAAGAVGASGLLQGVMWPRPSGSEDLDFLSPTSSATLDIK